MNALMPRLSLAPGRILAAIALLALVCIGLIFWSHQRWSSAQAAMLEQSQAMQQSTLRVQRAELYAEQLRNGERSVSEDMLSAELRTARELALALGDPLKRYEDIALPQQVQQRRADAARHYLQTLERLQTEVRNSLAESAAAPALAIRRAMVTLDEAALQVEKALHEEQSLRLQRQAQLTALTLLLVAALAAGLILLLQSHMAQREQALQALASHAARLDALTRALPEVSFLLDREGRYLAAYGPDSKLAAPREMILSRTVAEHIDAPQAAQILDTIATALDRPEGARTELLLQTPVGRRRFECHAARLAGQDMVVWISWDVTERHQAQQRVQAFTRLYSFLSQVNQSIVQTRSEPELFSRICAAALSHGGFSSARVLRPDPAAAHGWGLACRAALQGEPSADTPTLPPLQALETARTALQQGRTHWSRAVPSENELAQDEGIFHAWVALPLGGAGGFDAALLLEHERLDPSDQDEQRLFDEICSDIAYARGQFLREQQWQESQARVRLHAAALESTQDGVMVTDLTPRIVSVNRAFSRITGYTEADVVGKAPNILRSGRQDDAFYSELWQALTTQGEWQGELWNRRRDGELYAQWMSISTVRDPQGHPSHYVAVFTDITQQKLTEERLQQMAHFDPLTQLPNRPMVLARLEQAMAAAARQSLHVAVLFIDLDNFKTVNDSLGHAAGDALLSEVAHRLAQRTRREDTLGRLGGDEFVLVLEHLNEPQDAGVVAQELIRLLDEPFHVDGMTVYVQASVGISLYPQDGHTVNDLVRDADAAMYQAKRAGRNTYRYYTESLTAAAQNRLALDSRLRRALAKQEFELWYQPLVDIASRRLIGLEALVRLKQPDLPPVGPAEFIPVLEENGLIIELGEWVTRAACRQGRAWLDAGLEFGRIAINLSPVEVRRGGTDERVLRALADSGLPPDRLELEITESGLMEQGDKAEPFLQSLHSQGVRLAIDDFGTGYSSLAYLKRFPVHKLKIDRGFVRDLPGDSSDAQLVQTMVGLGHSLGMSVLAEGVETAEQGDFLLKLGCEAAQGYLYGAPEPADRVVKRLPALTGPAQSAVLTI